VGDLEAAFESFGLKRRFVDESGYEVEPLTPLLARAEGAELRPALRGSLDDRPAVIGLVRQDGRGLIVVITSVEGSTAVVPRLYCRPRDAGGATGALDRERAWAENAELARRYGVATSPYQDLGWVRRLFSERFTEWLVSVPAPGYGFELAYGDLVGWVSADGATEATLAGVWDWTEIVAARIARESAGVAA